MLRETYFYAYELNTGRGNTIILDFKINSCFKEEISVYLFLTLPLLHTSNRRSISIVNEEETATT
jgi:hypothetical protein